MPGKNIRMQKDTEKAALTREASVSEEKTKSPAGKQPIARERSQLESFEAAIRLFHSGKFKEARELFAAAVSGPDRGIASRAGLHIRMCDRRLEEAAVELHSAEDHYNYAVALINSRNFAQARPHLERALELEPDADHVYYALALCLGLAGDLQGAYENLKRAIDLQPRNRIAARQDADFSGIADRPPLDRLVYPEKKQTAF